MATFILGISAFYHDSAAALIRDGEIIAAAQEERFTRVKADARFPSAAIRYCLEQGAISATELDHVVFYEKPLSKFERLLETYLAFAPAGIDSFQAAFPLWAKHKLRMSEEIAHWLPAFRNQPYFVNHHEAHAASAFFPSPFETATILTLDAVGEWGTSSIGIGNENQISLSHEMRFPHSVGMLYSAFTYYTGFKVNSGEYKLMGLAPYGEPKYVDTILKNIVDVKQDGSVRLDMSYFNYCQGLTMTSDKFHVLFGGPPRKPESVITQKEMDLAASIQSINRRARVFVVPFGLDPSLYRFVADDRFAEPIIGFLANMKWMPGYLAARRLITRVFPLVKQLIPGAKVLVAGWHALEVLSDLANHAGVTIEENVSDALSYLDRLQVMAYPLPQGSGVKVKVLEAMARGIPVVTTTDGVEGIEATDGEHCFVADQDIAFAQRVVELLQNPDRRRAFRQRGRALIEERHSAVPVVDQLEHVYQAL